MNLHKLLPVLFLFYMCTTPVTCDTDGRIALCVAVSMKVTLLKVMPVVHLDNFTA